MKLLRVVCILGIAFSLCPAAFTADWLLIDPRELALKTPKLDPNVDAEIILWDVRLTDELMSRTDLRLGFTHYFCIKVYNDRGVESQGTVDLSWEGKGQITDIQARTIKPDGTIVELKKDAIFDKTVAKSRDVKVRAKSFALPGFEPGAINRIPIQRVPGRSGRPSVKTRVQRDLPSWHGRYHIKPLQYPGFTMQAQPFQDAGSPFAQEAQGYYMTEMRDIPAYKAEPRMPPSASVRPWMFIYYVKTNRWVSNEKDVIKE